MVVDDALFMRTKCVKLLTENGYEVVAAKSGAEAVAIYRESSPDVVLLDITMPDMDGFEALKRIRKVDPNARIAMVTALDQEGITERALREGANHYVVKPYNAVRILSAIEKLLS
jgi:two-component system chemotaxis response regulator CheY